MKVTHLHVYPVKGCHGIAVERMTLDHFGPQFDRRWAIVDAQGAIQTQRQLPSLATLRPALDGDTVILAMDGGPGLPLDQPHGNETIACSLFKQVVVGIACGAEADRWVSQALGKEARLVAFDPTRPVVRQKKTTFSTSFVDRRPVLLVNQASLDDVNGRIEDRISYDRFRPNIVLSGEEAFEEDRWKRVEIGDVTVDHLKPCGRCIVTTIDQESGQRRGREPLATLAKFRSFNREINFGCLGVPTSLGTIHIGDSVSVTFGD